MRVDVAEEAREQIDVPWDEVRAARVHRKALEAFSRSAGEDTDEVAAPRLPMVRLARGWWAMAAAAAVCLVLLGTWLLAAGTDSEIGEPPWTATSTLAFTDGSRSLLSEQAELQVLEDSDATIRVLQGAGRVRYEVAKRPERRFQVAVRGVTVTVLGTVFDVSVEDDKVIVAVERGRVQVVHGGRELVLGVGERVTLDSEAPAAAEQAAQTDEQVAPEPEPAGAVEPAKPAGAGAGGGGEEAEARVVARLLDEADGARGAGNLDAAAAALRKLIAEHPRDRRVTIALFTLGRVERQRGNHAAAAQAFEQCGTGLRGDALAEAASAWYAAGDGARGRAAAERYLRDFPSGVHHSRMRALLGRD